MANDRWRCVRNSFLKQSISLIPNLISCPVREDMEGILPTTAFSVSSSSSKSDRRSKSKSTQTSSKPSLVLALISCFAWLYVAGRYIFFLMCSHILQCFDLSLLLIQFDDLLGLLFLGYGKMQRTECY